VLQSLRHSVVAPAQARRFALSSEGLSRAPPSEKRARLRGSGCRWSSAERARAGRTANAAHRGGLGVVLGLPRLRRARPQPLDRPRVPGCAPRRAALAPRPHSGAACHPAGDRAVPDLQDAALLPWRSLPHQLPLSAAACGPAQCAGRRPHTRADDAALRLQASPHDSPDTLPLPYPTLAPHHWPARPRARARRHQREALPRAPGPVPGRRRAAHLQRPLADAAAAGGPVHAPEDPLPAVRARRGSSPLQLLLSSLPVIRGLCASWGRSCGSCQSAVPCMHRRAGTMPS